MRSGWRRPASGSSSGAWSSATPPTFPAGDLLIDVAYSSLNYKDALSAVGNPGVTRKYPHTPGIDAAGTVVESSTNQFAPGDAAIVIGFDLGMNTPGGFGQRIRVPVGLGGADARRPRRAVGHDPRHRGVHRRPRGGPSRGGRHAARRRPGAGDGGDRRGGLGRRRPPRPSRLRRARRHRQGVVLSSSSWTSAPARSSWRHDLLKGSRRPLLKARWGGAVDTVGGPILFNAVKALRYGASLAACGLVASPDIPATVFPFILRGVNLLGIDSVELPLLRKADVWRKLAGPWKLDCLETLAFPLTLDNLSVAIDRILAGEMVGRGLLDLRA